MSSGIEQPIDKIFSTEGTEWHGLADHVKKINDDTVKPLLFNILVSKVVAQVDDAFVELDNHKALIADFRECRPDLVENKATSNGFVPLHLPKNSYVPIPNRDLWEQMNNALKDIDAQITSAGTLESGKKFFISARLGKEDNFVVNGDKFLANLNFITSHDGSLAVECYDSILRVICSNTLRWSREQAGDIGFKVYHSKNANFAMKGLGDLVNAILAGRADFKNQMEYLASKNMTDNQAEKFLAGYFTSVSLDPNAEENLSTRSRNAIESIIELFKVGLGNNGKNQFDFLNGVTEYYTSGDGTGKSGNKLNKMYKANFGKAADHKNAIANALLSETRAKELMELGAKML